MDQTTAPAAPVAAPVAATETAAPITTADANAEALAMLRDIGEPTTATPVATPEPLSTEAKPSEEEEYITKVVRQRSKVQRERERLQQEATAQREQIELGKKYREAEKLRDENPLEFLKQFNVSTDKIIQKMVEDAEKARPQTLEEKHEQLEKKMLEREEKERLAAEEAVIQQERLYLNRASSDYQAVIKNVVEGDPSKFELINKLGQQERVWQHVIKHFKDTKVVLPPAIVAEVVEESLREQYKQEYERFSNTEYFQKLTGKSAANQSDVQATPSHNQLTQTSSRSSSNVRRTDLTPEEALQEAVAMLRYTGGN